MSLRNICFEHIKDTFYYGQFGEFKLVVDKNTGYFNATKLCKQGNKNYSDWFKNKRTKDLIAYIKSHPENSQGGFYEIKQDNKSEINQQVSGTYVRKELILDIASWISPEFYLKCNDVILKHFELEYEIQHAKVIKQKDDKIDELIKLVQSLHSSNNEMK